MNFRSSLIAGSLVIFAATTGFAQEYPPTGSPASWPHPLDDSMNFTFFQVDRAELGFGDGDSTYLLDTQGWVGTDLNKFWFKVEADGDFNAGFGEAEIQGLYSRMLTSFFDVQVGIRQDVGPGLDPTTYAVAGIQGLAPYWFEIDTALFLSDKGDLTGRMEAEYDVLFTQRLIGQPRMEVSVAAQDVATQGIGSGLSTIEFGFRLRYEVKREFAPYIGVSWNSAVGRTADFRRLANEPVSGSSVVAGIRMWF